jgi:hypothetical protein
MSEKTFTQNFALQNIKIIKFGLQIGAVQI